MVVGLERFLLQGDFLAWTTSAQRYDFYHKPASALLVVLAELLCQAATFIPRLFLTRLKDVFVCVDSVI